MALGFSRGDANWPPPFRAVPLAKSGSVAGA